MSITLYYFSGTGNSLHAARELAKGLPGAELVPMVRLLSQASIKARSEVVGFIFPNFCLSIPIPLHDFLEKLDLDAPRYIFALCTRGGTYSDAFDYINELMKKQGQRLDAGLNINMPWNHPLGKENLPALVTDEHRAFLETEMRHKLDLFAQHIRNEKPYMPEDTDAEYPIPLWQIRLFSGIPKSFNYRLHRYMYQSLVRFYSDEKCTGCGICEALCPAQKIKMVDKRPQWDKTIKCYGCLGCINYCPQEAIQIASTRLLPSYTAVNRRYHHPDVTHKDIAGQL